MPEVGICVAKNENIRLRICPNYTGANFECPYVVRTLVFSPEEAEKLQKICDTFYAESAQQEIHQDIKQNIFPRFFKKLFQR